MLYIIIGNYFFVVTIHCKYIKKYTFKKKIISNIILIFLRSQIPKTQIPKPQRSDSQIPYSHQGVT